MRELIKDVLRPVYRQKRHIERVQYWGRTISDGQAGHDIVRRTIESGPAAIGKIGKSELRGLVST